MNKEDFERLKAVCEKEGFKLLKSLPDKDTNFHILAVSKKDIWDGLEYAAVKNDSEPIYKIVKNGLDTIQIISRGLVDDSTQGEIKESPKKNFKPSTESAYIEQLKKEAHERFGEIKEGDRFDRTTIDEKWGSNTIMDKSPFGNFHWKYDRSSDTLFIGRFGIYSKGKWATRVKERVKVEFDGGNLQSRQFYFIYGKDAESKMHEKGCFKVGEFLASQLEKYLNGEIE